MQHAPNLVSLEVGSALALPETREPSSQPQELVGTVREVADRVIAALRDLEGPVRVTLGFDDGVTEVFEADSLQDAMREAQTRLSILQEVEALIASLVSEGFLESRGSGTYRRTAKKSEPGKNH